MRARRQWEGVPDRWVTPAAQPRQMVGHGLAGLDSTSEPPDQQPAQENLQAAVAADVVEGAPDGGGRRRAGEDGRGSAASV